MSESGFDRAFKESERRRLREQGADDRLLLDADEKQYVKDSLAQLLDNEDLTQRQLESWARGISNELQRASEQLTTEQSVQVLLGAGLPDRGRRRDRSDMSPERFREALQGDDGVRIPNINPFGGSQ